MLKGYTILFLFFLIAINNAFSQQYWLQQPCPTTKNLYRIIFVDTLFGWAGGDSGAALHTTNGGQNWMIEQTGTTESISDFCFLDRQQGWLVSNDLGTGGKHFLKTTDGGFNWVSAVIPDSGVHFFAIHYLDASTGFTGGEGGVIYKTTNSGLKWIRCSVDSSVFMFHNVMRIKFYNSQIGYATGGHKEYAGVIWVTSNGGLNWTASGVGPDPYNDIKILDSERVIFPGGDFEYGTSIITTTDHGINLLYQLTPCTGMATAISFRTPSEAWMPLTYAQKWAVSLDSGAANSWFSVPTQDSIIAWDVAFMSPTFGWAVGNVLHSGFTFTGALMKYNASIIGIVNGQNNSPENFVLYQNFPNPFNPSTTIKYYLPRASEVEIKFFDAAGRQVNSVHMNNVSAGYHSLMFDGGGLASGVYFYNVRSGEYSVFKKMVLIK